MRKQNVLALALSLCFSAAIADCKLIDPLAQDHYKKVQAAYNKGDLAEARKYADLFWAVHDMESCIYTADLGLRLVEVDLGKVPPKKSYVTSPNPIRGVTSITGVPRAEKY